MATEEGKQTNLELSPIPSKTEAQDPNDATSGIVNYHSSGNEVQRGMKSRHLMMIGMAPFDLDLQQH